MNIERPYRYTIIRYCHDRRTEEFVNVGVILESPDMGYLGCKVSSSYSRLTKFFPGAKSAQIRTALKSLERKIQLRAASLTQRPGDMFKHGRSYIREIWTELFPRDDSAINFTELKAGISAWPERDLKRIFDQAVVVYNIKSDKDSRSDDEVWRSIEPVFAKRLPVKNFVEHAVHSFLSEYTFEHSIRNGRWHCVEPISIDLVSAENIRSKVQKIYGAMALINSAASDVNVYFVLSDPRTDAAMKMYSEARQVIDSVAIPHSIYLESKADQLAEDLLVRVQH